MVEQRTIRIFITIFTVLSAIFISLRIMPPQIVDLLRSTVRIILIAFSIAGTAGAVTFMIIEVIDTHKPKDKE